MKSNMGAARMRRANRRIQFQEHAIYNAETEAYEKHMHKVVAPRPSAIRQIYNRITRWITGIFNPSSFRAINALDFRIDKGDRGRGARQLRAIFPNLGKMISTLDGKPV